MKYELKNTVERDAITLGHGKLEITGVLNNYNFV